MPGHPLLASNAASFHRAWEHQRGQVKSLLQEHPHAGSPRIGTRLFDQGAMSR